MFKSTEFNNLQDDTDDDGVNDGEDAFPTDPTRSDPDDPPVGPGTAPIWAASPVGAQFHNLQVGTPVNIDLREYVTGEDGLRIVKTNRAWSESNLINGLTFSNGKIGVERKSKGLKF